jgi:hypothetical protein
MPIYLLISNKIITLSSLINKKRNYMAIKIKKSHGKTCIEVLPNGSVYTKWKVFDKNGERIEETAKPMTPTKARKYFGSIGVIGIE